jgi:hypothetical protein
MNKKIAISLILLFACELINAQTSAYTARRDWYIGNYSGIYKDSTANTAWTPCSFAIFYGSYVKPGDDSTVKWISSYHFKVGSDSTLLRTFGFDANNTGRLKSNDSMYFRGISPSMGGGHSIYYKLKKMSSSVGLNENHGAIGIQVFPNPAQNYIHVSLPQFFGEQFSYRIYNSSGQLIESSDLNETQMMDISNLPKGIYYLGFYGKWNRYNSLFLKE